MHECLEGIILMWAMRGVWETELHVSQWVCLNADVLVACLPVHGGLKTSTEGNVDSQDINSYDARRKPAPSIALLWLSAFNTLSTEIYVETAWDSK